MVNGDREMVWKYFFIINFFNLFIFFYRSIGDVWFGLFLFGDYVYEDGIVVIFGLYVFFWYNDFWGFLELSRGSLEFCV